MEIRTARPEHRRPVSTEATFEDLVDALGRPGCAICRLSTRRADRFLGSYIYEHVNDVELRANIREARGFLRGSRGPFPGEARRAGGRHYVPGHIEYPGQRA